MTIFFKLLSNVQTIKLFFVADQINQLKFNAMGKILWRIFIFSTLAVYSEPFMFVVPACVILSYKSLTW